MDMANSRKTSNVPYIIFERKDLLEYQLKEIEESALFLDGSQDDNVMKPICSFQLSSEKSILLAQTYAENRPQNLGFFLKALNEMSPERQINCTGPINKSDRFYDTDHAVFYELTFDKFATDQSITSKLKSSYGVNIDDGYKQSKITFRLTNDGQYQFVKLECAPRFAPALAEFFYTRNKQIALDTLDQAKALTLQDLANFKIYLNQNLLKLANDYIKNKDQATPPSIANKEFFKKIIDSLPFDGIKKIIQNTCLLAEICTLHTRNLLKRKAELDLKNLSQEEINKKLTELDKKPVDVLKFADEFSKLLPADITQLTMIQRTNFSLLYFCLIESVTQIQNTNSDSKASPHVIEFISISISTQSAPLYNMYESVAYKARDLIVENTLKGMSVLKFTPYILKMYEEKTREKVGDKDSDDEMKYTRDAEAEITRLVSQSSADSDTDSEERPIEETAQPMPMIIQPTNVAHDDHWYQLSDTTNLNDNEYIPAKGVFDFDQIPVNKSEYHEMDDIDHDDSEEIDLDTDYAKKRKDNLDNIVIKNNATWLQTQQQSNLDKLIIVFYSQLKNLNKLSYGELSGLLKTLDDNLQTVNSLLLTNEDNTNYHESLAGYQIIFIKQKQLVIRTIEDRLLRTQTLMSRQLTNLQEFNSFTEELKVSVQADLKKSSSQTELLEITDITDFCSDDEKNRRENEIKQIQQDVVESLEVSILIKDNTLSKSFENPISNILANVGKINALIATYRTNIDDVAQLNEIKNIQALLSEQKNKLDPIPSKISKLGMTFVPLYINSLSDQEKISKQNPVTDIERLYTTGEKKRIDIILKQTKKAIKTAETKVHSLLNNKNNINNKNIQPFLTEILASINNMNAQVTANQNKLYQIDKLYQDAKETNLIQEKVKQYLEDIKQQYDDSNLIIHFAAESSKLISFKITVNADENVSNLEKEKNRISQDLDKQKNNLQLLNDNIKHLKKLQDKLSLNTLLTEITFTSGNKVYLPTSTQAVIETFFKSCNENIDKIVAHTTNNCVSPLQDSLKKPEEMIKIISNNIEDINKREPFNLKYKNFIDVKGNIFNELKDWILANNNFKKLKSHVDAKGVKTPILKQLETIITNANHFQEILNALNSRFLRRNTNSNAYAIFKGYESKTDKYITKLLEELSLHIKEDYKVEVVLDTAINKKISTSVTRHLGK